MRQGIDNSGLTSGLRPQTGERDMRKNKLSPAERRYQAKLRAGRVGVRWNPPALIHLRINANAWCAKAYGSLADAPKHWRTEV